MHIIRNRIIDFLNHRPFGAPSIALGFAALCFFAQPSFRAFKSWRSEQLLQQSKQLLEKESYPQAFYKAHAAVLLDNGNIDASRHLATLALRFGHPQAQDFWETVLRSPDSNAADWAYAVDACFRKGDYATAFDFLVRWKYAGVDDPAGYELRRAQAYALAGHYETAAELAKQSAAKYPDDEPIRNFFYQIITVAGSPEARARIANGIVAADSPAQPDLQWVANQSKLPIELRSQAIERLLAWPDTPIEQELRYLDLAAALGWPQTSERLNAVQTRIDRSDPEELGLFTTALCSLGEYGKVIELVDPEQAKSDRVLMRNLLVAQIEQGKADETLELTSQHRSERLTSLAEETLIRALAFREEGDQTQYQFNLDQAIADADAGDIAFLEQQFRRLGETRSLLDLYRKMSAHPKYGARVRYQWLELALSLRSEPDIRAALDADADWYEALPSPQQRSTVAYLQLVYHVRPDIAQSQAQTLASTFQSNPAFLHLLSLAYLENGNPKLARNLLQKNVPTTDPRSRLIAAAVTGNRDNLGDYPYLPAEKALLTNP